MSALAFRNLLEAGDVAGLRAWWAVHAPNMPQPESAGAAEIVMHRARTEAESVSFAKRAWSHAWLCERSLPSGLPDHLKPRAQRLYPVVVEAVGISVNARNPYLKPAMIEVRTSMEHAVLDAYAEDRREPAFLKARMAEARDKTMRALFGRTG